MSQRQSVSTRARLESHVLARLVLGPGWKKMLGKGVPAVLADMGGDGKLRPGSVLVPKF